MEGGRLLEIKDLRVSFFTAAGEAKAVDGVSWGAEKGEAVGIIGESGSGKSVTAYSVMRLLKHPGRVAGGSIRFDGRDLLALSDKEMEALRGSEIGMIFQNPMSSLDPVFTVGDQIMETIRSHTPLGRRQARARAVQMLESVGIRDPEYRLKQYPYQLSGGMLQRVMIAMALACSPKLLIADEPTTALDVTVQAQVLKLLKELREKTGMAIVFITHNLGVVADLCDRVAIMYGGRIMESGTADDIFYHAVHPYTLGLMAAVPRIDGGGGTLAAIEGAPVNILAPPGGCVFHPRCPCCMGICKKERPPRRQIGPEHTVSCWLISEAEEA